MDRGVYGKDAHTLQSVTGACDNSVMSSLLMKRIARAVAKVLVVLGWFAPLPAAAVEGPWLEMRMDRTTIFSSADRATTTEIARALSTFQGVMTRISGRLSEPSALPTAVYIFSGREGFEDFAVRTSNGGQSRLGGYVVQTRWQRFVVADLPADAGADEAALAWRSLFRAELERADVDLPIWLQEGLGDYFASFRYREGRAVLGGTRKAMVRDLRERTWLPFSRLEAIDRSAPELHAKDSIFSAQAWLIAHFVLHRNDPHDLDAWQQNLRTFLDALAEEDSLEIALETSVGIAAGETDLRLRRHLEKVADDPRGMLLTFDAEAETAGAIRILEEPEKLVALGDLLALALESDDGAERYYRQALQFEQERAAARRGLAYCADLRQAHEEAAESYELSLDLAKEDPQTLRAYAAGLLKRHEERARRSDRGGPTEDEVKEVLTARALLEKSLALDPSHPEAHSLLGVSYLYTAGNVEPGIAALRRALAMLPARPDITANLAFLLARQGSIDEADEVIARLPKLTDDRDMLDRAKESLVAAKLGACERLFAAGAWSDAEALLERLRSQASSQTTLSAIDARLERVRKALVKESLYEELHRAIDLANFGAVDQALKILDALREKSDDVRLLSDIDETRREILPEEHE